MRAGFHDDLARSEVGEPEVRPRHGRPRGLDRRCLGVGYHGFLTWDLVLTDVAVRAEDVLAAELPRSGATRGRAPSTFSAVQRGLDIARVHTAARAVDLARAAVEDCTAHLQERHRFGRPRGDFQALRFDLADMAAEVDQARAHYRQVAHPIAVGGSAEKESAMVKLVATEVAVRVTYGDAAARRQRLHPRTPGRTALAGRPAHHHLRGHQADPAPDRMRPMLPRSPQS